MPGNLITSTIQTPAPRCICRRASGRVPWWPLTFREACPSPLTLAEDLLWLKCSLPRVLQCNPGSFEIRGTTLYSPYLRASGSPMLAQQMRCPLQSSSGARRGLFPTGQALPGARRIGECKFDPMGFLCCLPPGLGLMPNSDPARMLPEFPPLAGCSRSSK